MKRPQQGFSLLEVLVAVAVLAIGLLGVARLQATGLANNQSAYQISQATVLGYDIADKMRANTAGINNYLTSSITLAEANAAGEQEGCVSTAGCASNVLAQNDLRDWYLALTAALPSPTGIITLAGDVYTITISWDINRDGSINAGDANLQVSFVP